MFSPVAMKVLTGAYDVVRDAERAHAERVVRSTGVVEEE